jgi:ABC-type Fe3+-citrate transport system substrate-binding protein
MNEQENDAHQEQERSVSQSGSTKVTKKVVALELPFRDQLLAYLGTRPTAEAGYYYVAIKQAGELDLVENGG